MALWAVGIPFLWRFLYPHSTQLKRSTTSFAQNINNPQFIIQYSTLNINERFFLWHGWCVVWFHASPCCCMGGGDETAWLAIHGIRLLYQRRKNGRICHPRSFSKGAWQRRNSRLSNDDICREISLLSSIASNHDTHNSWHRRCSAFCESKRCPDLGRNGLRNAYFAR